MAQQSKTLVVLPEDPSSISSTHMAAHDRLLTPDPADPLSSSGLHGHQPKDIRYMQAKHPYSLN